MKWSNALSLAGVGAVALLTACGDKSPSAPSDLSPPISGPNLDMVISGNATCQSLLGKPAAYEIKIDPPKSGTYGPITVLFNNDGKLMNFTSTVKVEAVFVKGGNVGGYLYGPSSAEGTKYPVNADANMGVAGYNNGTQQISHVSFCWNSKDDVQLPKEALQVTKTVATAYDREVSWDLAKSVDKDALSGVAGGTAGTSNWTITATKSETPKNFTVTGEITITNPNDASVSVSVSDVLDDGTSATITCPKTGTAGTATGSVPAKGSLVCSYAASPTTRSATSNNVNVSVTSPATIPGGTDLQPVDWSKAAVKVVGDDEVTLADDRKLWNNNTETYSQKISVTTALTPPETFVCPSDPSLYSSGEHKYSAKNTATLTTTMTTLSKDATVNVTCTLPPLTATKTAAGAYDRTIGWDLTKTVSPNMHNGTIGQVAGTSMWTVVATKSIAETNNRVTGTITVTNPGPIARTFSIVDEIAGVSAAVDCPQGFTLASGASSACTYKAENLPDRSVTSNTAVIRSAGNPDVEAKSPPFTYVANVIGSESAALADPRSTFKSPYAGETITTTTTKTFEESWTCPSLVSAYTNNTYTFPAQVNTATLTVGGSTISRSATVNVTCTRPPVWKGETATGAGTRYPNTGNWFMYSAYSTSKIDFLAGRTRDAGDIFMSRTSSTTTIKIVLTSQNWSWANVAGNLKIQPFNSAPTSHVEPGSFAYKFTIDPLTGAVSKPPAGTSLTYDAATRTATVTLPEVKAKFYGIHGDVQWLTNP